MLNRYILVLASESEAFSVSPWKTVGRQPAYPRDSGGNITQRLSIKHCSVCFAIVNLHKNHKTSVQKTVLVSTSEEGVRPWKVWEALMEILGFVFSETVFGMCQRQM